MSADGLRAAQDKMRANGVPEAAAIAFERAYLKLEAGDTGLLREADLAPLEDVERLDGLPEPASEREALDRVAVIKLNGGLATSMGLTRAKSLIEAREGHSFLDLIVRQVLALRERTGARLPLLLMDSFATQEQTLQALQRFPDVGGDLPADFVQNMEPKLAAEDLTPIEWPANPSLEWCPPGHGDLYPALAGSGLLEALLERGYEYAFVSNSDNLGATVDARIAAWLSEQEIPFAMEVVRRTESERKGGHIARRRSDGRLVLREIAQTPGEEADAFGDFRRWRFFNSNTLWIRLRSLAEELERNGGALDLPLIVNRKTVDPRDGSTPAVVQLESAMGAAIGQFAGARVLQVPRSRFVPVKTTNDLLVLRSDAYRIEDDWSLELAVASPDTPPFVDLDKRFYGLLEQFDERFPAGPPSLREAERLVVQGDVTFDEGVRVSGAVELRAGDDPVRLEAGTVLEPGFDLAAVSSPR